MLYYCKKLRVSGIPRFGELSSIWNTHTHTREKYRKFRNVYTGNRCINSPPHQTWPLLRDAYNIKKRPSWSTIRQRRTYNCGDFTNNHSIVT